MYQTVEAVLNNENITFKEYKNLSRKPRKVLVTFIDDYSSLQPIKWSREVLWTDDHKEFISVLKNA